VPEGAYAGLDAYVSPEAYGPPEIVADNYPDYPVAGIDADVAQEGPYGIDADVAEGFDGIDADVVGIDAENPEGFLYFQQ